MLAFAFGALHWRKSLHLKQSKVVQASIPLMWWIAAAILDGKTVILLEKVILDGRQVVLELEKGASEPLPEISDPK